MSTLVPYARHTAALEHADAWANLDEGDRRRRAMAAAQAHDVDLLCSLAEARLTQDGAAGARVSRHTCAAYRRGARALLAAWEQQNLLHPRRTAAPSWLRAMEAAGLKPATVTQRLAAARNLYAALRWAGATTEDPFRDARPARDRVDPAEKREPYSDDELTLLLDHAMDDDRVLILLGAHAGLRVSEMLALQWRDVDLARRRLRVAHGKGDKPRTVIVSGTLAGELAQWREQSARRETGYARDYVLPYRSAVSARRRLALVCARAGVEARAIHSLRHSAATRLLRETGSLEQTAQHLGHRSLETARIYAKMDDTALRDSVGTW